MPRMLPNDSGHILRAAIWPRKMLFAMIALPATVQGTFLCSVRMVVIDSNTTVIDVGLGIMEDMRAYWSIALCFADFAAFSFESGEEEEEEELLSGSVVYSTFPEHGNSEERTKGERELEIKGYLPFPKCLITFHLRSSLSWAFCWTIWVFISSRWVRSFSFMLEISGCW